MDFDFTNEQAQLRDAVRHWVERAYTFTHRRAASKAGGFDPDNWQQLARLGLTGMWVSEDHGGMGLGPIEAMIAMEELGRGLVLEPLIQALIASAVLSAYASEDLQNQWLPGIATGQVLPTLAYQERPSRYQLEACLCNAVQVPGGYVINGQKSIVIVGDAAQAFLVSAKVNSRLCLFLVENPAAGVSTRSYGTQDGGRAAEVAFRNAPAVLVSDQGLEALQYAVDTGVALTCAEAVGVMDKTLEATTAYLGTRKQFGVHISSFQALRHRVADMKMQLELARSMSYYASLKRNAPASERRVAMARAKYQLGVSMRFVGQQAVQLHGGIGVTDDYIVSHYFKKLTQLELSFGDSLHHLSEVSTQMQEAAGVFA